MNLAVTTALYEDVDNSGTGKAVVVKPNECYGTTSLSLPDAPVNGETHFMVKKLACSSVLLWIWSLCLTVLVAIALALSILSHTASSQCNCEKKSDFNVNNLETSQTTEGSSNEVPFTSSFNTESTSEPNYSSSEMLSTSISTESSTVSSIQEGVITLNNVSLYMDCNTSIEQTCVLGPGGNNDLQCFTDFGHTYRNPGEFIMDVSCVQVRISTEQNGLAFVLSIDEDYNEVQCFCYVVQLAETSTITFQRGSVTCGLRVTRCRTLTSVNTNYTIILSP